MRGFAIASILTVALLAGGCATRKYVRNTAAPIQAKVDQVGEQSNRNSQGIEETKKQVQQAGERAQSGIGAAQERASAAATRADEAMKNANAAQETATQAAQSADRANRDVNGLRSVVASLDDYRLQTSATVPFRFNQYALDSNGKQELDKLAQTVKDGRRFFIAVEGFTDKTGTAEYNDGLSRKRANTVVQYLVAQHSIPIYRIHMVGLGHQKPVTGERGRTARAQNRRVEVKVFTAGTESAGLLPGQSPSSSAGRSVTPAAPPPNR